MLLEGQQLTQYRLVQRLKSGSRGEVYLAVDEYHQHVAIKVIQTNYSLYPDEDTAEEAVQLFLREMQAIAQLEHPHILPVYNLGEEYSDGITLVYMVMPFHEEGSLADWLGKPEQPKVLWPSEVEHIVKQAASVLQCAHNKNVIHGNVKPSNFLICNQAGKPSELKLQLVDFGVAKFMTTSNESQTIRGTPMYMAPEQWQGQPCPETDQYALAVMAYKLLTGCPPFIDGNHEHISHQHRHVQPKPPSTVNPQISEGLDAVLLRALSKKPHNRYRSMAAFAQAFRRALDNSNNIIPINPMGEVDSLESSSNLVPTVLVPRANNIVSLQSRKKSGPLIKYPRGRYILLFSLLLPLIFLSLIFGGIGIVSYHGKGQTANEVNATALTSRNTTTAQAHSTSIPRSNATATAQLNATATVYASAVANGAPIINDPLQDNSQNYNWDTTNIQGGGGCAFTGGAYHASMPQTGYISACFAQATNFSNFSYQIQMTIIKGDQGGIVFRADPSKGSFYYFHISTSGAFALETYSNYNPSRSQPLIQRTSPAIKTGLNQTNLIAVVANGNGLKFFVNMQQIVTVSDGTYNGGKIGVIAEDISNPTEVVFRNVVVWPL
jgi:serine/threonine protein kinase